MKLTPIQLIGASLVVLSVLTGSTTQLTTLFGEHGSAMIVAASTILSGIAGGFITVMGGQSSAIKAVAAMANDPKSPIQGVLVTASAEGKALAASAGGTVAVAGTAEATDLAKP